MLMPNPHTTGNHTGCHREHAPQNKGRHHHAVLRPRADHQSER
nr:MAG TPA: hypothetical protein [Caudoviricetes sp.]